MEPSYSIEVKIKTIRGYIPFCNYILAGTGSSAEKIFAMMEGSPVNERGDAPFQMDLLMNRGKNSTVLATQFCTLAQLKENCHYISKEVFKVLNLE